MCACDRKAAVVAFVFIKFPETYVDSACFSVSAAACHWNIQDLFSTSQVTLKGLESRINGFIDSTAVEWQEMGDDM